MFFFHSNKKNVKYILQHQNNILPRSLILPCHLITYHDCYLFLWIQADKDFVWSLWKKLQVTNPDLTQAVGLVVQRYVVNLVVWLSLFSSPEHEVLMVSYCGQSMSVVRRPSCGVNNCFKSLLLLHPWANWLDTW